MDNFIRKYISFVKEDTGLHSVEITPEYSEQKKGSVEKSCPLKILRKTMLDPTSRFPLEYIKKYRDNKSPHQWNQQDQSIADESFNNNHISLNKAFNEFLLHGSVSKLNKFYSGEFASEENRMTFPTVLSDYYINKLKDISIFNQIHIMLTDFNSLALPCVKEEKNSCVWGNNILEEGQLAEGSWEIKLLNLGTLSTCPVVTRDFLFNNNKVEDWIMNMIINNTHEEIIKQIFNRDLKANKYIDSIFNIPKENIIKSEKNLIMAMMESIKHMECAYRSNAKFFMSRTFFNNLLQEMMENGNTVSSLLFQKHKTILSYEYMVLDQIEGSYCIFSNIKQAYILAIKNDKHLQRDAVTKKNFIKYFYSMQVGGILINPNAVIIINNNMEG